MIVSTLSATEAAHVLMIGLGSLRAWSDFLSDNIRGRQGINGRTLLPCCEMHDGRKFRPRYAVEDIRRFIADVRKDFDKQKIDSVKLDLDDSIHWRYRRFDKRGEPITSLH